MMSQKPRARIRNILFNKNALMFTLKMMLKRKVNEKNNKVALIYSGSSGKYIMRNFNSGFRFKMKHVVVINNNKIL